jgi:hypothetical protein
MAPYNGFELDNSSFRPLELTLESHRHTAMVAPEPWASRIARKARELTSNHYFIGLQRQL